MRRDLLYGILLLLLSLLLLEIGVRVVLMPLLRSSNSERLQKLYGEMNILPTFNEAPGYVYPTKRNSTHMQDFQKKWYPLEPYPSTVRIIGVGDSHLEGYGDGSLLAPVCERLASKGEHVECLNFGAGGYTLIDKEALLRDRLLAYDPDIVLLQLLDDDCTDSRSVWDIFPGERGDSEGFLSSTIENVNKVIYRASWLYRLLWWTGVDVVRRTGILDEKGSQKEVFGNLARCEDALENIVKMTGNNGVILTTFLSHPAKYDFEQYPRTAEERAFWDMLQEVNSTHDLSVIVLLDEFRREDYLDLRLDSHGHFNEKGYALAQDLLYEELVRHDVIRRAAESS